MFKVMFGAFWTAFMAFFTFMFYGNTGGTITVNGEVVSQAEFNSMLGPKIFIGLFWVIGIYILILGLKEIIKNYYTNQYGEVCYGRIINIFKSGSYVNNIPELKATVSVYIESTGTVEDIDEIIGLATKTKYHIGDYIEGKYYNGDINITSYIPENMVPSHIHTMLKDLVDDFEDTVLIDGVEYVKKNSNITNRRNYY